MMVPGQLITKYLNIKIEKYKSVFLMKIYYLSTYILITFEVRLIQVNIENFNAETIDLYINQSVNSQPCVGKPSRNGEGDCWRNRLYPI